MGAQPDLGHVALKRTWKDVQLLPLSSRGGLSFFYPFSEYILMSGQVLFVEYCTEDNMHLIKSMFYT